MESCLVTINDLKNLTNIGENVDVELLEPHLLLSQQMYFYDVVGEALYSDLISRFDNQQLTGDTQTLYENYIVQAIGYGAWFSAYPFLAYKTQRSGISTQTTDVLTPLTPDELSLYGARVGNLKDFYLNRLEDYLRANQTLFPLYRKSDTPQQNGGDIFLGYNHKKNDRGFWGPDYYYWRY